MRLITHAAATRAVHSGPGGGHGLLLNGAGATRTLLGQGQGLEPLHLYQGLDCHLLSRGKLALAGSDGHFYTLYTTKTL
jgi:hypothetical protein